MNEKIANIIKDINNNNKKISRLMTLSEGTIKGVPVIRTGIPKLDVAVGIGGLPKGRIVEIYGKESCGKTSLCLSLIAQAQKQGCVCGYIDAENAMDINWAKSVGVNVDDLVFTQPDYGEQALETAEVLIGKADVIVIDSVSALVPKAELDGDMEDNHIGLQARMMSQALRKITAKAKKTETLIIFINQVRKNIGVMFGSSIVTTGGEALKFYSSVRLEITRIGSDKKNDEIINNKIKIKVAKNKLSPPFKICEAYLDFKHGFDLYINLFYALLETGVIKKDKKTYYYEDGDKIGIGKDEAINNFRDMFDYKNLLNLYENYLIDKLQLSKGGNSNGKKKSKKGKSNKKSKKE